ncbi:MAG: mechanosensitive ion channel family protein [Campylobacterota bacterium]|nr:mechanosensitive ion channel family protein [Campylobacterota bacterium]
MKTIVKLILLFFILNLSAIAQEDKKPIDKEKQHNILKDQLDDINEDLEGNIWITRYNNYLTYRKIEKELAKIIKDAKKYGNWKGDKWKELSYQLTNKIKIKENELELISEYKDSPIGKQIKPSVIPKPPEVTNPISIIEAWTYAQSLEENMEHYQEIKQELTQLLEKVKKKIKILQDLNSIKTDDQYEEELEKLKRELKDFNMVVEIVSTTDEVYSKKIVQTIQELKDSVAAEIGRSIKIAAIIGVLFLLSIGFKIAVKKYIEDDDRYYTTNKLINFILIVIIIFVLLFSYIENVSYLVTILGFASAGIAIALKDWFMSIFGWMAIMTSGAITVGDRIKVVREGIEVVGDVLDISLFKISVREDVTITTYTTNRRSGRVFFIPNNYIFTDLISNYTFDNLRTVWDGIDIYITFDSNHKKAKELAKAIVETHSKGYTDLTRKRLQKMRKKYVLRSSNPDPRVFSFIEPYGIVISAWYYTNSHATLALRSTISMEILEAFKAADDIQIAYPTQTLRVSNNAQVEAESLLPGSSSTGLFDPPVTS